MHRRLVILIVATALALFGASAALAVDITAVQWLSGVNTNGIAAQILVPANPLGGTFAGGSGTGTATYQVAAKKLVGTTITQTSYGGAIVAKIAVDIDLSGGTQTLSFTAGGDVCFPGAAVNCSPTPNEPVGIPGFVNVHLTLTGNPIFVPTDVVTDLFTQTLSVGKPGTFSVMKTVMLGMGGTTGNPIPVTVTSDGPGWTLGMVTLTGLYNSPVLGNNPGGKAPTVAGVPTPNAAPWTGAGCPTFDPNELGCQGSRVFTGSVPTSTANSVVLNLVAPSKTGVFNGLSPETNGVTASETRLQISFLPEPGTLLLLGAGVAGLALVGIRRKE